jgi:hypothetical protein
MVQPVAGPKELDLNKPEAFDGNRDGFKEFLQNVEVYMDVNHETYNNDLRKIAFVLLFITLNALAVNCGPQSDNILSGKPNHLYKFLCKRLPILSIVTVLVVGQKITPFERPWSTMTKIESLYSAGGKSMIKSMLQCANGQVVIAPSTGIKDGCDGFRSILNCWQILHP